MVDTPIGTNSPNYMLQPEDVGATVFCRVTATNAIGSAQAFSNAVGPVAAAGGPVPGITTAPAVTVAVGGASVSCSTGTWTNSPTGYAYQWYSDETPDVAIAGATSATYVIDGGVIEEAPAGTSTWNPADKYEDANTTLLFTNGNKTAAAHFVSAMSPVGARGTTSQASGKWYFEVTLVNVPDYDGLIGLAAAALPLDGGSAIPGSDNSLGFGFRCYEGNTLVGIVYNTGTNYDFTEAGVAIADGLVLGFAVDMTTRTAWFRINGTWMAGDPVAGTGGLAWGATPTALFPLCLMAVTAAPDAVATINTGASAFAHTAPTGFTAWG